MYRTKLLELFVISLFLEACIPHPELITPVGPIDRPELLVKLTHGADDTAGGDAAYIISTALATYYLEKEGGGLSSMVDTDGVDWLGFHKEKGSGHKGEYRGFPNAVHKQDGNYFHAMNAGTDFSTSVCEHRDRWTCPDHLYLRQ